MLYSFKCLGHVHSLLNMSFIFLFGCYEFYFGEGHGNPLKYSCLENSIDRGTWEATVCDPTKSQT